MMLYSERKKLAEEFEKWLKQNPKFENCHENFIAYIQMNGYEIKKIQKIEDTGTMPFTYENNELVKPKYSIGTAVEVYREFEGLCGTGIILESQHGGVYPTYKVKLLEGHYLGKFAPIEIWVGENNIKESMK